MRTTKIIISGLLACMAAPVFAHNTDDPLLAHLKIEQLEWRDNDEVALEANGWIGYDVNKLWFRTEIEHEPSETEKAEWQALYSRAVTPHWDVQLGLRQDVQPETREWAVVGVNGVAPYLIEVFAAIFVGESGDTAARLLLEHELNLTQKWALVSELQLDAYGQSDERYGTGSGLSEVEAGLRLQYEVSRAFAPYIGVNWERYYGDSADFRRDDEEESHGVQWVFGVSMRF